MIQVVLNSITSNTSLEVTSSATERSELANSPNFSHDFEVVGERVIYLPFSVEEGYGEVNVGLPKKLSFQ